MENTERNHVMPLSRGFFVVTCEVYVAWHVSSTKLFIYSVRRVTQVQEHLLPVLVHVVFIDLEKAYDRVPRQEVWRCLREQSVPEKYVCLVKDTTSPDIFYEDARTQVKTSIWLTGKITVRVGLHQGSSLSPCGLPVWHDPGCDGTGHQRAALWCMLFADDIVLCSTRVEETM